MKEEPASLSAIVRQLLGCNQQQLADILEISRPLLAKVELGQRKMPREAAIQLANWYQQLQKATPAQQATPHNNKLAAALLKKQKALLQRQLQRARLQAERMQENGSRYTNAIHNISHLLQQPGSNKQHTSWLNRLKRHHEQQVPKISETKMASAVLRLQWLELMEASLNNL